MVEGRTRAHQAALNRSVADARPRYAGHREHVMALLDRVVRRGDAVVVLGAGNANDLDLTALRDRAGACTLVDIDAEALERAVASAPAGPGRLQALGGIDVTGAADLLDAWSVTDDAAIDRLVRRLGDPAPLPLDDGSMDVVVSVCLLSQLTGAATAVLGPQHPRALEVALAVRDAHLALILRLLRPGGRGVLITDVASTAGFPAIGSVRETELPALATAIQEAGGSFAGTSPVGIDLALREDPRVAPLVGDVELGAPWRWRQLEDRTQLVVAFTLARA